MARDYVCLHCRTALDDASCPGRPRHRVESIRTTEGREALRRTVWGPLSAGAQAKRAAAAGGAGGGITAADGCVGCIEVGGGIEGFVVVIFAGFLAVGFWLLYQLVLAIRGYARRPVANGAEQSPARFGPATAHGTVRATGEFRSPMSSERCAAYGLRLATTRWFRHYTTYRDGATGGLSIELDDGRIVDVPAGRCVVDVRDAPSSASYLELAGRLVADANGDDGGRSVVPFDTASQRLVLDGDRVSLHAPIEEVMDTAAEHVGGYRDAAPTRLVVSATPQLRVLDR